MPGRWGVAGRDDAGQRLGRGFVGGLSVAAVRVVRQVGVVPLVVSRIARELNMDPFRLRLRNAYRDGDMKAHRKIAEGTALVEVIQKAAELADHELPDPFRSMFSMSSMGEGR